jgi:hypothetical protein
MSGIELSKGFAAIVKLQISKKRPLVASGGVTKNCPMSPPE